MSSSITYSASAALGKLSLVPQCTRLSEAETLSWLQDREDHRATGLPPNCEGGPRLLMSPRHTLPRDVKAWMACVQTLEALCLTHHCTIGKLRPREAKGKHRALNRGRVLR